MRFKLKFYILLSIASLGSCDYPKDPNNTLKKIQHAHQIKIGVCSEQNDDVLLKKLSHTLHAKPLFIQESPDVLFQLLENKELDLMSCHIQEENPWQERVAFTSPYQKNYVWAISQGENAWLKFLDEFIYRNKEVSSNEEHHKNRRIP